MPPPGWHNRSTQQPGGEQWSSRNADEFSDFVREAFAEHARSGGGAEGAFKGRDIHSALSIPLQAAFDGQKLPLSLRQPVQQVDGSVTFEIKTLQVTVPVGVKSGQRIRLRGQGEPGPGNTAAGDLYIEISIEEDPRFTVNGRDVTLILPRSPWEAALGTAVSVDTLGGQVRLNVPT